MMRRHTSNHRTVEAYVDNELPHTLRLMTAAHLLVCPGCKDHADAVQAIKRSLFSGLRSAQPATATGYATARTRALPVPTLLRGAVGGTAAGIVFAAMTVWLMLATGVSAMFPLAATATIVQGQDALATANPFVGLAVHLVLAAFYGALFALIVRRARLVDGRAVIALGLLYGVALYVINFAVLANTVFDVFGTFNQPFQVLNHAVYGTLVGLSLVFRRS